MVAAVAEGGGAKRPEAGGVLWSAQSQGRQLSMVEAEAGRWSDRGVGGVSRVRTGPIYGCQPEVKNCHHAVRGDEDVLRFEVSMDDASRRGGGESVRQHDCNVKGPWSCDRASKDSLPQRLTFKQLGDNIRSVVLVTEIVNGEDVGV